MFNLITAKEKFRLKVAVIQYVMTNNKIISLPSGGLLLLLTHVALTVTCLGCPVETLTIIYYCKN